MSANGNTSSDGEDVNERTFMEVLEQIRNDSADEVAAGVPADTMPAPASDAGEYPAQLSASNLSSRRSSNASDMRYMQEVGMLNELVAELHTKVEAREMVVNQMLRERRQIESECADYRRRYEALLGTACPTKSTSTNAPQPTQARPVTPTTSTARAIVSTPVADGPPTYATPDQSKHMLVVESARAAVAHIPAHVQSALPISDSAASVHVRSPSFSQLAVAAPRPGANAAAAYQLAPRNQPPTHANALVGDPMSTVGFGSIVQNPVYMPPARAALPEPFGAATGYTHSVSYTHSRPHAATFAALPPSAAHPVQSNVERPVAPWKWTAASTASSIASWPRTIAPSTHSNVAYSAAPWPATHAVQPAVQSSAFEGRPSIYAHALPTPYSLPPAMSLSASQPPTTAHPAYPVCTGQPPAHTTSTYAVPSTAAYASGPRVPDAAHAYAAYGLPPPGSHAHQQGAQPTYGSFEPQPGAFAHQHGTQPMHRAFESFGYGAGVGVGYGSGYQQRYEQRKLHDLPIFSGRPEEWPMFASTYRYTSEAYGYTQLENLTRLQKSLSGEAKQAVECLLIHPQHVDLAMRRLEALYGRPEQLVRSQLKRARELPIITEERIVELIAFATSVQNLALFLDTPATHFHLADPTLLEELVRKLPMGRRIAWAAEAAKLAYHPTIMDFARWVSGVADLIGSVAYESDQTAQASKPSGKPANQRHVLLSVEKVVYSDATKCVFCSGSHSIDRCNEFLRLSVTDRWAEARTRALCYACLCTGHIAPNCDRKRKCGLEGCDRWHNRKLHITNEPVRATSRNEPVQATSRNETVQATSSKDPLASTSGQADVARPVDARRTQQHRKTKQVPAPSAQPAPTSAALPAQAPMAGSQMTGEAEKVPTINHCSEVESTTTLFRVVPVTLHGRTADVSTFALLDEGSSITLVDADLALQVGLEGPASKLNVQWFSHDSNEQDSMKLSFDITGQQSGCKRVGLQNVRTVKGMSLPPQTINAAALVKKCPHLRKAPFAEYANARPKLLIGLDHHHLGVPTEIQTDVERRSIVAAKTPLGWVLYGSDGPMPPVKPVILHAREAEDDRYELLNQLVRSHFSTEAFGTRSPEAVLESDDTKRAREILKQTTRRVESNRFETGLLWRSPDTHFPASFEMALKRLKSVESRMHRNPQFRDQYVSQIEAYLQKGYARRLTDEEARQSFHRSWFLPHFAVFNDKKPGKFRLVFDAAATVGSVSLNSELLTGPDVNTAMLKLLMQFRVGTVGIVADIREMFHQVRMRTEDQVAQKFLWRSGDSTVEPNVYAMTVMTFGATCSPAAAQHVKNLNAEEFAADYPEAATAIRDLHYVDDYVASFSSAEDASRITADVVEVHRRGGFELRGFVSNSRRTLELLGANTGSGDDDAISMQLEPNDDEKVLGMCWNTSADAFQFQTKFVRVPPEVMDGSRTPTKREILSVSMSLFDPYGLIADFALESKLILQDLWRIGLDWDEPVSNDLAERWENWRKEVERTKLLQVPRCYSPYILSSEDVQLHIYADASEAAFSAVAFWRVAHAGGFDVSFVLGRTRCAPLQTLTIPRLELQAAVLATRLLTEIRNSHPNIATSKVVLWSDSATVLSWLNSDQRKYKPFVQFRIAEILESTPAACWRWVPTSMNVADDATRVRRPVTFRPEGRWTRGPAWLRLKEDEWPVGPKPNAGDIADRDAPEEVRRKFIGTARETRPFFKYESFYSFRRLCRVAALVRRYIGNLRRKASERIFGPVDALETESAMLMLCRLVQTEVYAKEMAAMRREEPVDKASDLYPLHAYLEGDLLRMCGRTDAAEDHHLPFDTRRPILLPRCHRFTWLLVKDQHERTAHQLANATIAAIRRRFWVPQVRVLLNSIQSRCVVCKRRSAMPVPPVQGQLPADRLTPYVRPFTSTGLDYFGPVNVSVGRRREKRWVAVFTCLAIRAVHLEVATDLSTDACLVCVRNLCHLRGTPCRIRCDNGTNFVGARNALAKEDGFLDAATMQRELSVTGIQWVMNCPGNPEAGGIWERLVQAVKRILAVTLKDEAPRVETLRAHLLEASNMLNSRPLTHISVSPEDDEALTPNHFLIGGPNAATMSDPTEAEPAWVRQQWRICRELSRRFWTQWIDEYLPELTRRSKNHPERKELGVDDIVVVCDPNQPRGRWPLGRIVSVVTGRDGRVRTAEVKTKDGVHRRPVARLAVLDIEPDSEQLVGRGPDCR